VLVVAFPAWGQDVDRGKLLYETHCVACHYERIHNRKRTKITNLSDLRDEVALRATMTKRRFELDELEAITQYLNRSHYKLAK
jgi:hypothetical protein